MKDIEEEKFGSSLIGLDKSKKPAEEKTGIEQKLPPLEDPSVILTSPEFPRKKTNSSLSKNRKLTFKKNFEKETLFVFLGPKLNESIEQDPEMAREVISSKLKHISTDAVCDFHAPLQTF